jgi:hypothetical protein
VPGTVVVRGYRELDRAFADISKDLRKEERKQLKEVAEPVRALAEQMAAGNISNIGAYWSRMRLGVTSKVVYVAPKSRKTGRGSPRPNLAGLLLDRAMQPALDSKSDQIMSDYERWVGSINTRHGF